MRGLRPLVVAAALLLAPSAVQATCTDTCIAEAPLWAWAITECDGNPYRDGCECDCTTAEDERTLLSGTRCSDIGTPSEPYPGTATEPECELVQFECVEYERGGAPCDDTPSRCGCAAIGPGGGGAVLPLLAMLAILRRRATAERPGRALDPSAAA